MNFFEHQDQARQNTVYLLGLFVVAVIVMIILLYGVVVYALYDQLIWQPELFLLVALGMVATVGGGSVYKSIQLRGGGKVVAEDLGGTLVDRMTEDELEKRLLNIVEEMAIASGISVPEVYVLGEENGINAFAAGFTPNDAVIGVTRGCLEQLARDELQGVIAHEFSHILNGDMRLNLRLIGVIQGLIFIYLIGRALLRGSFLGGGSGKSSSKDKDSGLIIGLGMVVIGGIGFFCGRLIKSAVSRQREFLADASAVQFTRNPDGISGALQKIAGYKSGSKVKSPMAEEASHLFFGEAFTGIFESFGQVFSTHPPVKERIKRLEGFAGRTWSVEETGNNASISSIASGNQMAAGFAGSSPQAQPQRGSLSVSPGRVVARVGTTNPKHLDNVRGFLADIPEPVRMATRDVNGAIAIIYSLLLHTDPEVRDRQMSTLRES